MKRVVKILKLLIKIGLGVFVLSLLFVTVLPNYHKEIKKADAIIILGAAIKTPAVYNRSLEGLRLYQQGKAPVIVLAGGVDYKGAVSEAEYMQQVIEGNSTTPPPLFLDKKSGTTFENIQNAKKLVPDAKSVIIVSDNFHLARGVVTAKAFGFSPVYWSAPDSSKYYSQSQMLYHYLREAVALIAYIPKLVFK